MSHNVESHSRKLRGTCRLMGTSLALSLVLSLTGATAFAQSLPSATMPRITPKVEIFAGYSYLYPNATASGSLPYGIVPVNSCLCAIPYGAGAAVSYDFNRWVNITVDGSAHLGGKSGTNAQRIGNADAYNVDIGPQFKLRGRHLAPFAEVLFGEDRLAPSAFHPDNSFGMLAGGGLDLGLGRHFAFRVFQADFVYANHGFGPTPTVAATQVRGLRLQSGLVISFGGHAAAAPVMPPPPPPPPPPPVVAAAPVEQLSITATASPSEMVVGQTSTITANGVSSLGRPMTYSYSSTLGTISGTGTTAVLSSAGSAAGTAVVTATVVDDMAMTAVAKVPVVLDAPEVMAAVQTSDLCTMGFGRDVRRPARVDNEAKACLDQIALSMGRNSDARLALIGSAALNEPHRQHLAADRAVHVKEYLVKEKGIDPGRIDVYTDNSNAKTVRSVSVPAGATLNMDGLTPVTTP